MKIGVVIDRLNVGGVEKIAIEEVIALRKLGNDASLVVLREQAVVENAFPDLLRNVPVLCLDQRLPRVLRFSFRFPVFSFFSSFHLTYPLFLPFVLRRKEFDYFIVHGTYTAISATTIKKCKGIGFSAFIWDPASYILGRVYSGKFLRPVLWLLTKLAVSLDRFLINNMDSVLVGGTAHNEFIHAMNQKKPIKVIYPSVHPTAKPLSKSNYILVVTAWKQGKNPEYLLDIARELPMAHFKIAGKWLDPAYRQEFEQQVKRHGLEQQIEIVGEVSEAELTKLYSHARALLQTNDDRGFGLPALEAAGQGTTFIIPEGQGVCNLFINEREGYYTKEKDTPAILTYLKPLLADESLAAQKGRLAWRKVKDNYSWQEHAKELMKVAKGSID